MEIDKIIEAFQQRELEGIEKQQGETFYALGLAGEAGEYCNLLKKRRRGDLETTELTEDEAEDTQSGYTFDKILADRAKEHKDKEARELADVVLYVAKICQNSNIDLTPYLQEKFNKYSDKIQSNVKI